MKGNKRLWKSLGYSLSGIALVLLMVLTLLPAKAPAVMADDAAWLDGWDNRLKITIDQTNIDDNLTHFPILIHLSSDCGQSSQNMTAVFNEVGSNSKKIAATTDDGQTQLYVEIEKWDSTNKEAWLWVSKSGWTVSSTANTTFYLYYDNDQPDNTNYVGLAGSVPAQYVWDYSYKMVQHLEEASGALHDSTANGFYGTQNGSLTYNAVGKIDSSLSFNGTGCVSVGNIGITGNWTTEFWAKLDTVSPTVQYPIGTSTGSPTPPPYGTGIFIAYSLDSNKCGMYDGTNWIEGGSTDAGIWYHLTVTKSESTYTLYLDGQSEASGNLTDVDISNLQIGKRIDGGGGWWYFYGTLDEVRISNTARSVDWIKANYYSSSDNLLSFEIQLSDNIPPAAVNDLRVVSTSNNTITLNWTAPGDDGNEGTASQYDIRYATLPIDNSNWASANQTTGEPSPQIAGSSENFTVTGLNSGITYYFGLKTADEMGNWSYLNCPNGTTQ